MKTQTYQNKDGTFKVSDTRGLERHNPEAKEQLEQIEKPDVLWLVLNYHASIEDGDFYLIEKFDSVPAFIILNKCDSIIRQGNENEIGKFDGDFEDLPAHFKRNQKLMNLRDRLLKKKQQYPNIKRIILTSLTDEANSEAPPIGVNFLHSLTIACFTSDMARSKYIDQISIDQNNRTKLSAAIIAGHVAAVSGAAWIPVPALDSVAITGLQITMLVSILKVWGADGDDPKLKALAIVKAVIPSLIMFGVGYGIAQALKFLPFYGTVAGGALFMTVASTGTIILGTVATLFCRSNADSLAKMTPSELKSLVQNFMDKHSLIDYMNTDLSNMADQ